jgi:hypothetical protein
MNLTSLCFVALILIMVPVIYYGTRSKLQYARQIFDAQAKGTFSDLNTPKVKSHIRRLAAFALIGVSGMILSFVVFVILLVNGSNAYFGVVISVAILFGVIGATAGLLMQREINRRL